MRGSYIDQPNRFKRSGRSFYESISLIFFTQEKIQMRNLVISGIVVLALLAMPFAVFAAFTDGLVLYLTLDEGSGDVAGDSSGNGHDGVIDGPDWVDGKYGKALKFAGAESGTFVTVESTDALNVNELTFSAWINAENWDGTRQIVGKSVHGGCSGRVQYGLFSEAGIFRLRFETEAAAVNIDAPALPPANEWVNVAFTNDGAKATIYINGVAVVEGDVPGPLKTNDDPWRIAQDCERTNYIFAGAIDDVRLWNRALSADELNEFIGQGVEILGGTSVEPQNKLSTKWAKIKSAR
jgi:hypothetical protein